MEINEEKSRTVDLKKGESFGFLGFAYRLLTRKSGTPRVQKVPKSKKRTALFTKLREEFRRRESQPVKDVIAEINPILRGWVNYFRIGNSSHCFAMVKRWVERKVRRHMMRARQRLGMGWKWWSTKWIHGAQEHFVAFAHDIDRIVESKQWGTGRLLLGGIGTVSAWVKHQVLRKYTDETLPC